MEQHTPQANGMALAAMILGIISIPTVCCIGFGFPVAATGIILALLSRRGHHMNTQAKVGFSLSLGSLILSTIAFFAIIIATCSTKEFQNTWNDIKDIDLNQFDDQQEMQEFFQNIINENFAIPDEVPSNHYDNSYYPDAPSEYYDNSFNPDIPFFNYEEYFSETPPVL